MNTPIYDQLIDDFRREYRAVPGEHVPVEPLWPPPTPQAGARHDTAETTRAPAPTPHPPRRTTSPGAGPAGAGPAGAGPTGAGPTGAGPAGAGPAAPGPARSGLNPSGPMGPLLPGSHLSVGGSVGTRGGWQFPPPDAFPTQPLPPTVLDPTTSGPAPAGHRPALPPSADTHEQVGSSQASPS